MGFEISIETEQIKGAWVKRAVSHKYVRQDCVYFLITTVLFPKKVGTGSVMKYGFKGIILKYWSSQKAVPAKNQIA